MLTNIISLPPSLSRRAMIRTLGRRSPRTLLNRVSETKSARAPTEQTKTVTANVDSNSPIAPVYVELTAPLLPQPTDPQPSETILALDPTVFRHPVRRDILHLCIVHHRDATRQGSASTKTRGEVAGSGKKIRPQKGSGRARLGDAQSPMLRGGGVAFGPKPRDFSTKLPRKVIDMGMRVALSLKVKENEFGVMSQMLWDVPKTGLLTKRLEELCLSETLFVTGAEQVPDALKLAIRNIPKVTVMPVKELKVFDLLKWRRLVLDTQAVDALEHNLARQPPAAL